MGQRIVCAHSGKAMTQGDVRPLAQPTHQLQTQARTEVQPGSVLLVSVAWCSDCCKHSVLHHCVTVLAMDALELPPNHRMSEVGSCHCCHAARLVYCNTKLLCMLAIALPGSAKSEPVIVLSSWLLSSLSATIVNLHVAQLLIVSTC